MGSSCFVVGAFGSSSNAQHSIEMCVRFPQLNLCGSSLHYENSQRARGKKQRRISRNFIRNFVLSLVSQAVAHVRISLRCCAGNKWSAHHQALQSVITILGYAGTLMRKSSRRAQGVVWTRVV